MPFDRSGVDLSAHAMRALRAWRSLGDGRVERAIGRGLDYLRRSQRPDGSWVPLWFGNQYEPDEENPVYGTSRVLMAFRDLGLMEDPAAQRAVAWLAEQQRADGGWGPSRRADRPDAVSSVEETALAVEALLARSGEGPAKVAAERGVEWLVEAVEAGRHLEASPIGFYFARLWYYESLYPNLFCVSALGRARGQGRE